MTALAKLSCALVALVLAGCQDSPTIAPPATSRSATGSDAKSPGSGTGGRGNGTSTTGSGLGGATGGMMAGGTGAGSTTGTPANPGTGGGDGAEVPAAAAAEIEFPALTFNGQGKTLCGDQNLRTDTQIVSRLSKVDLTIERANVHVECYHSGFFASAFGHACDDAEFNAQIMDGARGVTTYNRYTLDDGKRDNVKVPGWAIMAKSIKSTKGELYELDKPIPVFPMPAAAARYKDLDQPQTFTANVKGPTNAAVQMKVTKLGMEGDIIKLRFELTLNGDPNTPQLYDKFPIPHSADFDVGTSTLDLRGMSTHDLFIDDKGCDDGGKVDLTYQLCRKQTSQKVEDTQMPYCQG